MPGQLIHLADRLLNTPLLLHPAKAEIILGVLGGRIGVDVEQPNLTDVEASRFIGSDRREDGRNALTRAAGGVAVVSVLGSLVNRGAWLDTRSGLTSYEGLAAQIRDAATDPEVSAIVLDISSPGGEASGMAGLADLIRQVGETKSVTAFVNDMATSAAYGIASAAQEIVVSPTSMVGSIGVVMLHADHSGELASKGIKPTLIFAGSHKVDGNPFEPLSEDVRADLQASVDAYYEQFLGVVSAGRGARLTADMTRATEARTFIGAEAVTHGLADRVATFDDVLTQLSQTCPTGRNALTGVTQMSKTDGAPAADNAGISLTEHEAALTEACAQERARIRSIVTSEIAEGRMAQALVLATETTLSIEEAEKLLAASPKETGIEALAVRASDGLELGATRDDDTASDTNARTAAGWKKAIATANRRFENA